MHNRKDMSGNYDEKKSNITFLLQRKTTCFLGISSFTGRFLFHNCKSQGKLVSEDGKMIVRPGVML